MSYWVSQQDPLSHHFIDPLFILGFLDGARRAAMLSVCTEPKDTVGDWLSNLSQRQLVNVHQFFQKYGNRWFGEERVYPDGCDDLFQLVYYMAHGRLPALEPRELNRHVRAWVVDSFDDDDCMACFSDGRNRSRTGKC
jgi:hypothetical protein